MSDTARPQRDWPADKAKAWLIKNCFLLEDGKWFANLNSKSNSGASELVFETYEGMVVEGICRIFSNDSHLIEQAIYDHLRILLDDENRLIAFELLQKILSEHRGIGAAFFALMDSIGLTSQNGFCETCSTRDMLDLMVAYRAFKDKALPTLQRSI